MEHTAQRIAKICVEHTTYAFDKAFDYLVPQELAAAALPGCRVLVPFGRGNQKRQGMILSVEETENPAPNLKAVFQVLDEAPLLQKEFLEMVFWLKERYFCTLFEAVHLLLPTGVNFKIRTSYALAHPDEAEDFSALPDTRRQIAEYLRKKRTPVRLEKLCADLGLEKDCGLPEQMFREGVLVKTSGAVRNIGDATTKMVRLTDSAPEKKLTPRQKEVFEVLEAAGAASVKEICYFTGVTPAVLNTMVKNGAAEYFEQAVYRNPYASVREAEAPESVVLSPEQQTAYDTLLSQYRSEAAAVSLLYGVTGSGKTLVFLKLIDEAVRDGKGVIVMVPEISLTPQTIGRFHQRYGKTVAVFHNTSGSAVTVDAGEKRRSEYRRRDPLGGLCAL